MYRLWKAAQRDPLGRMWLGMLVLLAPLALPLSVTGLFPPQLQGLWVILVLPCGLVAGILYFFVGYAAYERREAAEIAAFEAAFAAWAAAKGWAGEWPPNRTLPARGYPFTRGGVHEVVRSRLGEIHGQQAVHMHYRITRGRRTIRGDNRKIDDFTITAAVVNADFPVISVKPQRGFERLKAAMGYQDLDVESVDFNRRWRVTGDSPQQANEVLHPLVMARLLAPGVDAQRICWDSNTVMIVSEGHDYQIERLDKRVALLTDLADLVRDYMARPGVKRGSEAARSFPVLERPRGRFGKVASTIFLAGFPVGALGWIVAYFLHRRGPQEVSLAHDTVTFLAAAPGYVMILAGLVADRVSQRNTRRTWLRRPLDDKVDPGTTFHT